MRQSIVIVRAFAGEPLKRVVVEANEKRAAVALPETLDRIASGEMIAISLPRSDLYQFEPIAFERLRAEWEREGSTNPQSWRRLKGWAR